MEIWSAITRLSIKEMFHLSWLMFQNPLFVFPTIKATKRTLEVCEIQYKNEHHKHGKANAFRHALWNILICKKTFFFTKNDKKSIIWAKKITDLHEKLAPNDFLERMMDLHNNRIGRSYFSRIGSSSEEEMIAFLKKNTKRAKRFEKAEELKGLQNDLVYLFDD